MLNLSSIYFGQKHKNFDYKDFDIVKKISRLARKHQRQCENDCNGEGYIRGFFYRCDSEKGYFDYKEGITVFTKECEAIEEKINTIIEKANKDKLFPNGEYAYKKDISYFAVKYQGDPRGNTVKLYYEGDFIEL